MPDTNQKFFEKPDPDYTVIRILAVITADPVFAIPWKVKLLISSFSFVQISTFSVLNWNET